ncbi:hypothetical protein WG68_00895 [Arsukibacterium ikkense]|uniref:DUF4329 domain-containing protein n=1 Tax=Arsukibacterium ikkense TaxID=336831 RepID=A0A0M2VDN1_9GAMM|nr:hypothetical protein [Arsukibacterium ikkense]KKO47238.1 hypothetical protein WG68_00895 [Arsukibacterium ikkense]
MDNKDIKAASGRRKFLVRAGIGSLPVLMALKSKGAWGYSTQNCNLSASMSKMQSVQGDQFESCVASFHSHGAAKQYFYLGPSGGNERKGYFHSASANYHKNGVFTYSYAGIELNENTLFSDIFAGGFDGTIADAVEKGPSSLIRDIAGLFLHAMFYRGQGIYPEPDAFVDSYNNAIMLGKTDQLAQVLQMYIDGE